jgi:hypothetical protein
MRKIYLLSVALLFASGFVFAQKPININAQKATIKSFIGNEPTATPTIGSFSESFPDTIYIQNFGGGNASSWVPAGWSNAGVGDPDAKWEYRGPSTTPNNTVGSRGACMSAINAILTSPTVANGFFIFDSNYLDDPGTTCAGALGTGVAPAPHRGDLTSEVISTVGYSSVMLVFNYYIRDFQGEQRVEISTDGGTTWTEVWEAGLNANQQTALTAQAQILLPAAAGNNANLKMRFVFDGDYYAWQIDDVMLVVPNANDLKSTNTEYLIDDFWSYLLFTGGDSVTCSPTHIPLNFMDSVSGFGFYQNYINLGTANQTNVKTQIDVTLNAANVHSSAGTGITVPTFGTGMLGNVVTWKPSQTGKHIINYSIVQNETDVDLTNNTGKDSLVITDSIYAREWFPATAGLVASGLDDEGDPEFANNGAEYFTIANMVDVTSGDTVTSISFRIDPAETRVGALLSVNVLDFQRNPYFASFPDGIEYTVTQQDLTNGWIEVSFYQVPLEERILPSSRYYAAVSLVDNLTGQKDLSIRYYNNMPFGTQIKSPSGTQLWAFYTGVCAVIRLNFADFNPFFSTEENSSENLALNAYPNPANQQTTIAFSLNEKSDAMLNITDLSGKAVYSTSLGERNQGLNQINVDLSSFSNGVYLYTITANGNSATRKLIVKK